MIFPDCSVFTILCTLCCFSIVFLGNGLNPMGQLNLAMLWNRVDIAKNKIMKEVAEKGCRWTVGYPKVIHNFYEFFSYVLQKYLNQTSVVRPILSEMFYGYLN